MTTIFDTATPKQIEKFAKFKQELLDWKNQHARDYTAFVRHMNSDDPEAMIGLGHLLAILSSSRRLTKRQPNWIKRQR